MTFFSSGIVEVKNAILMYGINRLRFFFPLRLTSEEKSSFSVLMGGLS
jgi:hypothetical protein